LGRLLALALLALALSPLLSAAGASGQVTLLPTAEMKAGEFYEIQVLVSNLIYTVEIYLETLKLGEHVGGVSGPLDVKFLIPPYVPPGEYTLYVRVVVFLGGSVEDIVEEYRITVYWEVEPEVRYLAPLTAAPGAAFQAIVATMYRGEAIDAGQPAGRLLEISEGSLAQAGVTVSVAALEPGLYLVELAAPEDTGLYLLELSFPGGAEGAVRDAPFKFYAPLLVTAGDPGLDAVLAELRQLRGEVSTLRSDVLEAIGASKAEILDAIDRAAGSLEASLAGVDSKLDEAIELLGEVRERVVALQTDTGTIIGVLEEIEGGVAVIETSLGRIEVKIDEAGVAIAEIRDGVAVIETAVGELLVSVDTILQRVETVGEGVVRVETAVGELIGVVSEIRDGVAVIETDVGEIIIDLEEVKASVVRIDNDVAIIKGDIGTIAVNVDKILAGVERVEGRLVKVNTALGELTGVVEEIRGDVAIVSTEVGKLAVRVDEVEGNLLEAVGEAAGLAESAYVKAGEAAEEARGAREASERVLSALPEVARKGDVALYSFASGLAAGLLVAVAVGLVLRRIL
jgi:archaellum component FlaC